MDVKDIAEQSYKNGYEDGKQETAQDILLELERTPIGLIDGTIVDLCRRYGVKLSCQQSDDN